MFDSSSLARRSPLTSTKSLALRPLGALGHGVYNVDGIALSKTLKDNSVAAWIFDPPFPKVEINRAMGTTTRLKISKGSSNPWFASEFNYDHLETLLVEASRTLVPGGHFLMKCDADLMKRTLRQKIPAVGGKTVADLVFQKILMWDKQALGTGYVFRSGCEYWFWAVKGKDRRRVKNENLSLGDVFRYKRLKGKKYAPAQMPLTMTYDLVNQVTQPGDLVFDPTCGGGGTVPIICNLLGRKIVGCELDPSLARRAAERVARAMTMKDKLLMEIRMLSAIHCDGGVPPNVSELE